MDCGDDQAPAIEERPAAREHPPIGRYPGDVLRVAVGALIVAAGAVIASNGAGTFERDLFHFFNHLPSQLLIPLFVVMQAGSQGAIVAFAAVALAVRRVRLARDLAIAGFAALQLANYLKTVVDRPRPGVLMSDVILRHASSSGLGYPSGHTAVAAALATAAGPFLPRPARYATWVVVALVGIARMYVGVHFPLDVVGGAALGLAVGATLHLVLGAPRSR
jgi:membrane-associated phospholipid phosphatase